MPMATHDLEMELFEGSDDGDKSIITFIWPADVKGTHVYLSHKVGRDDQWLYLPTLKRVKRISSRNVWGFGGSGLPTRFG